MEWWESEKVYLQINNTTLPVEPGKGYSVDLSDQEQIDKTEAGTSVRDVVRMGIPAISVSFDCDRTMLIQMRNWKNMPSVNAKWYNPTVGNDLSENVMYVTGYKETMLADTPDGGIWKVSFTLQDLEGV